MVRDAGRTLLLTPKERALLRVLTVHPGRLYTREHLLDALYGFDAEADSNTLEVFISRLRRKLGRERILTVRGDRKSTRLNSSHSQISYAVFCLKKKKKYK